MPATENRGKTIKTVLKIVIRKEEREPWIGIRLRGDGRLQRERRQRRRKGKKPKVPSAFRQFMMQRALVKKKKAKFVVDEIARAEKDTKTRWLALKKERAASAGLQFFLDGIIDEMMEEVVVDSLRTSEREKDRAQAESRVVFEFPQYGKLHFGIYQRLHQQWLGRKEELKAMMST